MQHSFYKQLILCIFFFPLSLAAQENPPELITDRPDQTESSAIVPLKSLQLETGFVMENSKSDIVDFRSFAYNTTLLRFGLLKNFELRLGLAYLEDRFEFDDVNSNFSVSGFSPLSTGFKIKITEEKAWVPEVAFLGGLVLPFTASKDFKPDYTAGNLRFAFSHSLSDRLSLGYNLGAEWDGFTAIPGYFYSIAVGITITNKAAVFLESYGLIHEEGDAEHLVDAGFTFLVLPNLQLDLSGGLGLNEYAPDNFISMGFSYRLPQ